MAYSAPPSHDQQEALKKTYERRESAVKLLTALVALLTAIAGALGTFWGLTAKKANDATTKVDTSNQQVQQLQKANENLQTELATANKTIQDLRASATASRGDPSTSPNPSPGDGSQAVYHHGVLTLTQQLNFYPDLDAPRDDPQWGLLNGGSGDIGWYADSEINFAASNAMGVSVATQPSYQTCRTVGGYASNGAIAINYLKSHPYLCIITSEKRFVALKITSMATNKIVFDVTTYAKDGD
ncbi:hypothetical protein ACIA5C_16770 [Actinoplanes sp. NPDC051343]|uniref:hypothetical protein n=1 Tax=Actinoplanes sp. NPDC051343 TaxID=3363906 RepID=UPI0037BB7441